jgi:hypothetical protein
MRPGTAVFWFVSSFLSAAASRSSSDCLLILRSSIKRPFVPTLFAVGWIAVWALLAGCQSGAQQDLVARELRMQEDQIYAMEDYLTQYQQLVCKYRSENAALRRRLTDDYYDGEDLPPPRKTPRAGGDRTTPPGGTSIEIRETPGREGGQPPSREIEIELPDVPPLEGSTSNEAPPGQVVTAAYNESGEAASAAGKAPGTRSEKPTGKAQAQGIIDRSKTIATASDSKPTPRPGQTPLRLHGEVVEGDPGAGPRLVVNVEIIDEAGSGAISAGEVSLMLLAQNGKRGQQSLARWDFGNEDIQAAKQDAAEERIMQFYLELPAETPRLESTELWARLVPSEGEKLLARASVDLRRPGLFASMEGSERTEEVRDEPAIAADGNAEAAGFPARIAASLIEGDWTIARPGEPANLPGAGDDLTGSWRASSEPMPAAVPPPRKEVQPAHYVATENKPEPPRAYKPPTWSPERPGAVAVDALGGASGDSSIARRSTWTATR